MKLFTKYYRINLFATVIIFLLASFAFSFVLRYFFINQVDNDLRIEQHEIETYVAKNNRLPEVIEVRDQQTHFVTSGKPGQDNHATFETAKQYDHHEKEENYIRKISFYILAGDQWYLATVTKSLEGTEDLIQSIIIISVSTILLILIATFLINRIVLRKLWQPFYNTLQAIRGYKIGSTENLKFSKTDIEEFDLMNNTLQESMHKAKEDYKLLKEFTENASHELQTPLAVIRSKLDLLIQDENLSEPQSHAAGEAYDAIQKLSRINQSLLLLARIENKQFEQTTTINLKENIEQKLQQFRELWQAKNLAADIMLENAFISINPTLADILFNNLFGNATRHNISGGSIHINLKQNAFAICNTGRSQALNENKLFNRFYKTGASSDNHGLGLAIIKQICEVSGCTIRYQFSEENMHMFTLHW